MGHCAQEGHALRDEAIERRVRAELQAKIVKRDDLLKRAANQIMKWAESYGSHNPKWLPPDGDVRLLEDIQEVLG